MTFSLTNVSYKPRNHIQRRLINIGGNFIALIKDHSCLNEPLFHKVQVFYYLISNVNTNEINKKDIYPK